MMQINSEDLLTNEALQGLFLQDISAQIEDEEVSASRAFLRVCIDYLGFDPEAGAISDGKGDNGIDYIEVSSSGASIIQAKSVEFEGAMNFNMLIGPSYISDLPRIRSLFENLDDFPPKLNSHIKRSLGDVKHALRATRENDNEDPFHVTVYFCAQAKGFTEAASAEFNALNRTTIEYGEASVEITYIPVFLEDLLDAKWRQSNTKWKNKENKKCEKFDFDTCGTVIRDSSKSCVFFTRASQLVNAYKEIGYQIFESNVRCEIKNSPVNKAIKNSILTNRGREDFKHLNNGITIICENFQFIGSRENPSGVRITHPGIINGLQTVKTLSDSVSELPKADFEHFDKNCQILVRVHTQTSVKNYRDLVKSTNNQNPMKPRNLRSNDSEQIIYERYFAEKLGWFYERKEGAWSAFKSDHTRWSTINRRPQQFMNGRLVKKVDNEEIAQAWLAFIGFSEQAVDQKRYLFSPDRSFYELIFLNRTAAHGEEYNHKISDAKIIEQAELSSPTSEGMLAAYLIREFAKNVVRTRKENREDALKRLKIESLDRAQQEAELEKDTEYLKGMVLRGMLLLFVEFFGYTMFSTYGKAVHGKFGKLLNNGSLADMWKTGDVTVAKARVYDDSYDKTDVLLQIWQLYNHCVSQLIAGAWLRQRQQAANLSKFTYSERTTEPLYNELTEANKIFKDAVLIRKWTTPFNSSGSVGSYIKSVLGD